MVAKSQVIKKYRVVLVTLTLHANADSKNAASYMWGGSLAHHPFPAASSLSHHLGFQVTGKSDITTGLPTMHSGRFLWGKRLSPELGEWEQRLLTRGPRKK